MQKLLDLNKYLIVFYSLNMKYENICKVVQNKMSMRYATFKSTESREKQKKNKKSSLLSKKHKTEELKIQKTNQLKQTTLKTFGLHTNNIQDKLSATDIIQESDSESEPNEIAPSPLLNKTALAKNAKRKVIFIEVASLQQTLFIK